MSPFFKLSKVVLVLLVPESTKDWPLLFIGLQPCHSGTLQSPQPSLTIPVLVTHSYAEISCLQTPWLICEGKLPGLILSQSLQHSPASLCWPVNCVAKHCHLTPGRIHLAISHSCQRCTAHPQFQLVQHSCSQSQLWLPSSVKSSQHCRSKILGISRLHRSIIKHKQSRRNPCSKVLGLLRMIKKQLFHQLKINWIEFHSSHLFQYYLPACCLKNWFCNIYSSLFYN